MQSRISPNLAVLKFLMNIPPQSLELDHAHTTPTYPTTIFSSIPVLDMMLPILPLPLREGMYMQLMVPLITMVLLKHMGHNFSPDIDTPSDDFARSTKPNMANNHQHPYMGFIRIITGS